MMSIIELLLVTCIIVKSYYHYAYFKKILNNKDSHKHLIYPPVTILICARNEAHNLKQFLGDILRQKYSNFEVLVVNHLSSDKSQQILIEYQEVFPQLRIVEITEKGAYLTGKRQALYEGIKKASHDIILCTDADCFPKSALWVEKMVQPFVDEKIDFVLGYSPYTFKERNWLAPIIESETSLTAMLYLSYALSGKPFMGVGRNVAFKKSILTEAYWEKYQDFGYGDDDLIIQTFANKENTKISISAEAQTSSYAKTTFKDWLIQKTRHISVGKSYKPLITLSLGIYHLSGLLFLFLLTYTFICGQMNFFVICSLILFVYLLHAQINIFRKKMNVQCHPWIAILIQFFMPIYYFTMPIISVVHKKQIWKENQ